MGGVYSSNVVSDSINSLEKSFSSTIQNCSVSIDQSLIVELENLKNVTINIDKIEADQVATLKTGCIAESQTQSKLKDSIDQQIEQVAKAINQNLSLNPSSTIAQNLTLLMINQEQEIIDNFNQTCVDNINQTQKYIVSNVENSTITIGLFNVSQAADAVVSCIQHVSVDSNIESQISQQISQVATAKVANSLAIILLIIFGIIILVASFEFGSGWKKVIGVIVVILLIGLYFLMAYFLYWPPFTTRNQVKVTLEYSFDGTNWMPNGTTVEEQRHAIQVTGNAPIYLRATTSAPVDSFTFTIGGHEYQPTSSNGNVYQFQGTFTVPGTQAVGGYATKSGRNSWGYLQNFNVTSAVTIIPATPQNTSVFSTTNPTLPVLFSGSVISDGATNICGATVQIKFTHTTSTTDPGQPTTSLMTSPNGCNCSSSPCTSGSYSINVTLTPGEYSYTVTLLSSSQQVLATSEQLNFRIGNVGPAPT